MAEVLEIPFAEFALYLAVFFLFIDFFLTKFFPSHIAYILIALGSAAEHAESALHQVVIGIVVWGILILFHMVLWRKMLHYINDKWLMPQPDNTQHKDLAGKAGRVKSINGELFISVDNRLIKCRIVERKNVTLGQLCHIASIEDDVAVI